jgi:signal transduction histidine kinase/ActR/RegA family two-component response regulator
MTEAWIAPKPADPVPVLAPAPATSAGARPLRVALSYAAIALAWISATSLLVSPDAVNVAEILKGGAFVAVTAIALYVLLRRHEAAERAAASHSGRLEDQLRQAQRLEAVGQLTGGVAHDFNNLLTVIIGNAGLLAAELQHDPDRRELAESTLSAAHRAAELTRRLLAFARLQNLEPRVTDVGDLVAGIDSLVRRTLGEHVEIVIVRRAALWPALVDPAQLESAILNLAINGRDAMPDGGRLVIEVANAYIGEDDPDRNIDVQPGPYVVVAVTDTGTGIAPEHLGRVFDPFFTTKEVGRGTGLGLSMVFGFVKQSGGHIKIDSEVGRGTTVTMYLPRATSAAPVAPDEPAVIAPGGSETILLVEDDDLVRRYAHDRLAALGYRVVTATDGREGLAVIRAREDIDLLFTDVIMPGGMSGPALAEAVRDIRPRLPILFTSGYSENAIVHGARLDPDVQLLAKPYGRADLARAIRVALASVS